MSPTFLLLVLGMAMLTAAAPSYRTCCDPDDWEAMALASAAYGYKAGSKAFSGRVAVDHSRKLASMILFKDLMDMNDMNNTNHTSMVVTLNNSDIFFYFLHDRLQQQQMADQKAKLCSAWVFHHAISGLENRCFPDDSASFIDQLKVNSDGPSLPASLIAYNFGGLARILAIQAFVSAHDCSPQMFSMSTPSNGLKLSLALNSFSQGHSDNSFLSGPPALCSDIVPDRIDLGGLGIALLEAMDGSKSNDNSWIDDMVTMYAISHIRDGRRHKRDLSSSNETKMIEEAMALKALLMAVKDFIGDTDDDDNSHNDIETSILLNKLLSGQNKQPSDVVKGMLLDRLLGGNTKDSSSLSDLDKGILLDRLLGRDDDSSSDDVKKAVLLEKLLSMRDDSRRDDSDDVKKALLLDQILGRKDDSSSDDDKKAVLLEKLLSMRDDSRRDDSDDVKKALLLDQIFGSKDDRSGDDVKKAVLLEKLLSMRDDSRRDDDMRKAVLLDHLLSGSDDSTGHDDIKAVLLDTLMSQPDDSHVDDAAKSKMLEQLLSGDAHDGVLGMLFSRRSRRDLTDVLDDGRRRSSFDQDDVDAMMKFFIARQLICDSTCDDKRRRSADYSDLESLAELLVARNLLSGTKKDKQDQFIQAAQTLLEMQSMRDFHSLVNDMIRYGLLDQQSKQGPDLRRLVMLGALEAALSNQKGHKFDSRHDSRY